MTLPGAKVSSHGRVALVTGSSSGFGLESCVALARRGFRVFASMRDLDRADRLDAAMVAAGTACDKVRLDVTDPTSIEAAMAEIGRAAGPVDVLVNNAGFGFAGFVEDLTLDELREQFETNFFGLVAVSKAVIRSMRERRWGRIINVSSVGGRIAWPGLGAYAGSKFAVEGLSESLRHELLPHGVYVTLIEPGTFPTDIFDRNRRVAAAALDDASPNRAALQAIGDIADRQVAASRADPASVGRLIARVATARRPRLRYLVGVDARRNTLLKAALPWAAFESVVGWVIRPRVDPDHERTP